MAKNEVDTRGESRVMAKNEVDTRGESMAKSAITTVSSVELLREVLDIIQSAQSARRNSSGYAGAPLDELQATLSRAANLLAKDLANCICAELTQPLDEEE
jgi:hypothetical protein